MCMYVYIYIYIYSHHSCILRENFRFWAEVVKASFGLGCRVGVLVFRALRLPLCKGSFKSSVWDFPKIRVPSGSFEV